MESLDKLEESERSLIDLDMITKETDERLFKDKLDSYVAGRVKELEESSDKPQLITIGKREMHKGFISSQTEFKRNFGLDGFRVDDPEIYKLLVKSVKDLRNNPGWNGKQLKEMIFSAINYAVAMYFGNYEVNEDQIGQNQLFYMNRTTSDSQTFSIGEMRGRGIATCAEKASVAQNLISFMGKESYLALADCKLSEDDPEAHVYNIVKAKNGYAIFDPTNPVICKNRDQGSNEYYPAIYPISLEEFEGLQDHQPVEVTHTNYDISEGSYDPVQSVRSYNA